MNTPIPRFCIIVATKDERLSFYYYATSPQELPKALDDSERELKFSPKGYKFTVTDTEGCKDTLSYISERLSLYVENHQ